MHQSTVVTDAGIAAKSISYLHYPANYHFMIITLTLNVGCSCSMLDEMAFVNLGKSGRNFAKISYKIQLQTLLMG